MCYWDAPSGNSWFSKRGHNLDELDELARARQHTHTRGTRTRRRARLGALLWPEEIQLGFCEQQREKALARENATQSALLSRPEALLCVQHVYIFSKKGKLESQTQRPESGWLSTRTTRSEFTKAP